MQKNSFRNSTLYKFYIKMYLEPYAFIDHLYYIFWIIYRSIFKNLNMTLNYWFISKTSNNWDRREESY